MHLRKSGFYSNIHGFGKYTPGHSSHRASLPSDKRKRQA